MSATSVDERTRRARAMLAAYMVDKGKRNTRQRDAIVGIFLEAGQQGHVSLQELLELVQASEPGVGFATVYRTMKMLTEAGVALERHFGEGQSRYELTDVDEHHDHIICTLCGTILEFEDAEIERRQREIAALFGMKITHHRHEIYGLCRNPESCKHRGGDAPPGS